MADRNRETSNLIAGLSLVVIGALFLAGQILDFSPWRYLWPLFIIIPGLVFFAFMHTGGAGTASLAIPGSIITTVGLLLAYQNITGHWQSWAYAWTIFPAAVGFGMQVMGRQNGDGQAVIQGRNLIRTGLVMFAVAGIFFELILNISGFRSSAFGKVFWPVVLVLAGLYLIFGRGGQRQE